MQKKALGLITFSNLMHIILLCLLNLTFKIISNFKLSILCTNLNLANYQRSLIHFFIKTSGKHNVNTRFVTRSTYYVLKNRNKLWQIWYPI